MSSDPQLAGLTTQPAERHKHIRARGYIGSSALGISDGLVTNLAFLSGFAGATNNLPLIRFAGIASMLAGAISMFFGGLLAERSEYELYQADAKREAGEIEQEPEEEKSELRNFYVAKGLSQAEAGKPVQDGRSDRPLISSRCPDTLGSFPSSQLERQLYPSRSTGLPVVSIRGRSVEGSDSRQKIMEERARNIAHRRYCIRSRIPDWIRPCFRLNERTHEVDEETSDGKGCYRCCGISRCPFM